MIPFTKTYPESAVVDIQNGVNNVPMALTFNIDIRRSNSGVPTPTNINPIIYWQDVKLYVSDEYDELLATVYNFNIKSIYYEEGIYGGKITIDKNGVGTVWSFYGIQQVYSQPWVYNAELGAMCLENFLRNIPFNDDGIPEIYFPQYETVKFSDLNNNDFCVAYVKGESSNQLYIKDSRYTDPTYFKSYIYGYRYIFKRPSNVGVPRKFSYDRILSKYGQNYVWADCGNITELNCSTYDISEYRAMLQQNNPQHIRVTFIVDNIVFEDNEFSADGFNLTSYMNPDVDLTFGVAFMSEVRLNFMRSTKTDQLNWTREFKVELGVEDDDEAINWIDVGIFAGNRPILTTKEVIEFSAYDRMQRFSKNAIDFINLLTYPCTLQNVYDKLCKFIGVGNVVGDEIQDIMSREITYDIMHKRNFSSCRELLASIAEATGCYAKATTDGQIKLVWFEDHTNVYNLDRSEIFNIDSTDLAQVEGERWQEVTRFKWQNMSSYRWEEFYDTGIPLAMQGITAVWTDTDETVTQPPDVNAGAKRSWDEIKRKTWDDMRDTTWYDVENLGWKGNICTVTDNPFMYYEDELDIRSHLQKIVNRIRLFPMYFIANISAVGDWLVEPGDVISLELEDGSYTSYPIFSRVLAWNGSCECDYESTGSLVR